MKAVAILSGGLDSTVLAYHLRTRAEELHLVSFDYGQRHFRELEFAEYTAKLIGNSWVRIDLSAIGELLNSALTSPDIEVPDGHYAEDSMKATVVPNRNAIMLSIATGIAISNNCDLVAFGAHGGDHFIYPDCRADFVKAFDAAMRLGNLGFANEGFCVVAPFSGLTKAQIVRRGAILGVPFENTWSCYKGGFEHCGTCGTCVERREAFILAGVNDPTKYQALTEYQAPAMTAEDFQRPDQH